MNASELKTRVIAANKEPYFFTRATMTFFGDTMRNYGVRAQPVLVTTGNGTQVSCWELYRRRPVKHGLRTSAFFDCSTLRLVSPRA